MSKKTYSVCFETFAGHYVHLVVEKLHGAAEEGGMINLRLAGYMLDEDEDYFFIGSTAEEITSAIKKSCVAAIIIKDEVEDLMNQIDVPSDQEVQ